MGWNSWRGGRGVEHKLSTHLEIYPDPIQLQTNHLSHSAFLTCNCRYVLFLVQSFLLCLWNFFAFRMSKKMTKAGNIQFLFMPSCTSIPIHSIYGYNFRGRCGHLYFQNGTFHQIQYFWKFKSQFSSNLFSQILDVSSITVCHVREMQFFFGTWCTTNDTSRNFWIKMI